MRTAAARVWLGLEVARLCVWKKTNSSGSLFIRRSTTLAEADVWKEKGMISGSGSGSELELTKGKSLYVCFFEKSHCLTQIVRPIRLNSDDGAGNEEEEEGYLSEAAYKWCRGGFGGCNFSARFGSQILFPFLEHINRVDTSTRPIKFEDSSIEFSNPKFDPVLGVLNGKLYCYDANRSRPFEVLDDDCKWRPLESPPFTRVPCYASILEGSNKVLAWQIGNIGVCCYDDATNRWKDSSSSLANTLPFLGYHDTPPTFIHNHHPHLGAFYLVLDYDPYHEPLLIFSFYMSDDCDQIQPIYSEPIRLPEDELRTNYLPFLELSDSEKPVLTDHCIAHLGGQKFCLVLSKFYTDHPVRGKNTGILLLMTFEYDIIPNGLEGDIQTRFLGTRRFRYHSEPAGDKTVYSLRLTGAFVL